MVYRATITCGARSFSEDLDPKKLNDEFIEAAQDDERPCGKAEWKRYTRPIASISSKRFDGIGRHALYRWVERVCQADYSPMFALTEFNDANMITYKFEQIEE